MLLDQQRTPIPPCHHVHKPAAPLRASSVPYLRASTAPRLQRHPRPRCLRVATPGASLQSSMSLSLHTCIVPLELHTSTSLRLHRVSRPPYLPVATPIPGVRTSRVPYLYSSTSAHVTPAAPDLHAYIPPCRHACSEPSYLYSVHLQGAT